MAEHKHGPSCHGPAGELQCEQPQFEPCPAFPGFPAPHHWVPLAPKSAPYGQVVKREVIEVIEVCPSCQLYRQVSYKPLIVPRSDMGVQ